MDDGPIREPLTEAEWTKVELIGMRDVATGNDKRILRRAVHRIDKLETALRRISSQAQAAAD